MGFHTNRILLTVAVLHFLHFYAATGHENKDIFIRCRSCGAKLAKKKDFWSLSDSSSAVGFRKEPLLSNEKQKVEGRVHMFVNPQNIEFELATFLHVLGITVGEFDTDHSFYKSYGWQYLQCHRCNTHVGWHFTHKDLHKCFIQPDVPLPIEDIVESSSTGTNDVNLEANLDDILKGKCLVAINGWWTYELCYKEEVRQYHEVVLSTLHNNPDGSKINLYSMGIFNKKKSQLDTAGEKKIRHFFEKGQPCDETGKSRTTQIRYSCCKSTNGEIRVLGIKEPNVCAYIMEVCVPQLCTDDSEGENPNTTLSEGKKKVCMERFARDNAKEKAEFFSLMWPHVIVDSSDELLWMNDLKPITALSR